MLAIKRSQEGFLFSSLLRRGVLPSIIIQVGISMLAIISKGYTNFSKLVITCLQEEVLFSNQFREYHHTSRDQYTRQYL